MSDDDPLFPSILLSDLEDGSGLRENLGDPNETVWVMTDYSEDSFDSPFECVVCDEPIYGEHLVCLDGGDSAHVDCVKIRKVER